MDDKTFQMLTFEEKWEYAHEHPTEVIYELTKKGKEYLKQLEEKSE